MSLQNGKKPLSQKVKATPFNEDDLFGNPLSLDVAIKTAIESKGLVYRFINAAHLQEMAGYHPKGWRPIKLKDLGCDTMDSSHLFFGSDPDGYLRRGDCILAVRSKEMHEKHKEHVKREAVARALAQSDKSQAQELRRLAKQANFDTVVEAGFEDEEQ